MNIYHLDKILCSPMGLDQNTKKISYIDGVEKPFEVKHKGKSKEEKLPIDLLWSVFYFNLKDLINIIKQNIIIDFIINIAYKLN